MSWQQLLQQQTQQPVWLSAPSSPAITILDNWRVIQVSGDDAASYLQNLLTNDLRQLQDGQAQLSGFCNPKGRLLAVFILLRRQHGFDLIMPTDIAESVQKRLTMFVLRSKVQISSDKEKQTILGILSNANSVENMPEHDFTATEHNGLCQLRVPGTPARMLLLTDNSTAEQTLQDKLAAGWQHCSEKAWQAADIAAGLPFIFANTQESFTPQQVNLDLLNGVSFKKGCYPGQEVVARLHYLGSPSRRLFLATLEASNPPQPGDNVVDNEETVLGQVVQAQQVSDNLVNMLVTMKLASVDKAGYVDNATIKKLEPLANDGQ